MATYTPETAFTAGTEDASKGFTELDSLRNADEIERSSGMEARESYIDGFDAARANQ